MELKGMRMQVPQLVRQVLLQVAIVLEKQLILQ